MIRRIYQQLAPQGVTVTESAEFSERHTQAKREIDILLEVPAVGEKVRIAVECRDHARPADVTWIDALVGKYRDLPVDRVVAVARSGFTPEAAKKALANRIETKSLKEGLQADWPVELIQIGIAKVGARAGELRADIWSDPKWTESNEPVAVRIGEATMMTNDFKLSCVKQLTDWFWADSRRRGVDPPAGSEHLITFEVSSEKPLVFLSQSGVEHRVSRLVFHTSLTVFQEFMSVEHARLGEVGVSASSDMVNGEAVTIMVVQEPGSAPSARIYRGSES
jgi:hypothetical protein